MNDKGYPWEFPDEASANNALKALTEQALGVGPQGVRNIPARNVHDGHWANFKFEPYAISFRMTPEVAMHLAKNRLCSQGIRPPGWLLGEVIGELEKAAFLYALTHNPVTGPIATPVLGAAGVSTPKTPADLIMGVGNEVIDTMKFSWAKNIWSGVRSILWATAAVAVPSVIVGVFSPETAAVLQAKIPVVGALVSAAFLGLGNSIMNWWKNRNIG